MSTSTPPTALPESSPMFNDPTADLLFVTSDNVLFRVHSLILRLGADHFRETLGIDRRTAPSTVLDIENRIPVPESSHVFSLILQFMYPYKNPTLEFQDAKQLHSFVNAVLCYGVEAAKDAIEDAIIQSPFLDQQPLYLYHIAESNKLARAHRAVLIKCLSLDFLQSPNEFIRLGGEHLTTIEFYRITHYKSRRADAAEDIASRLGSFGYHRCNYCEKVPCQGLQPRRTLACEALRRWPVSDAIPDIKASGCNAIHASWRAEISKAINDLPLFWPEN
ncbi:hypothetical protein SISNIDRAFT_465089 [Sistotremastrum niveocremeum HHB9708]|uniref:BTB domain-containing protein n=1 Tax=Sistotremastrum niveocremeum HHB9708 TaxID=1314777 RepID=A0A164W8E6_9AGAM|nr:hypothetical protein SISNIDRAFT_465089 [Sistotremastrum niveocremeum HHB9708]